MSMDTAYACTSAIDSDDADTEASTTFDDKIEILGLYIFCLSSGT